MANSEIKYEVLNKIGILSTSEKGWTTELRLIKWNDRDAKYDIRPWSSDGTRMGKGITLTKDEAMRLRDLLNALQLN